MDTLKWLLKASLLIAFMFLGLKAKPKQDKSDEEKPSNSVILRMIG